MKRPLGDEVRCPKCGKAPPVRRVSGDGRDVISYVCCGEAFPVTVSELRKDEMLEGPGEAA